MSQQCIPIGPKALSLSGGGSKGAYTVGVLKYLWNDLEIKDYKIIYGTSTGALISALLAAGIIKKEPDAIDKLVQVYSNVTTDEVINSRIPFFNIGTTLSLILSFIFGASSAYKTEGLKNLINTLITEDDWDAIVDAGTWQNPIEVGFAVSNLRTGKGNIITNTKYHDKQILKDALLASSSIPVLMPPVTIQIDNETSRFVDGGLMNYNPIEYIFMSGLVNDITSIISINLDWLDKAESDNKFDKSVDILMRTLDLLQHGVYEKDYASAQLWNFILSIREEDEQLFQKILSLVPDDLSEYIMKRKEGKRNIPIINMEPGISLNIDSLDFNPTRMSEILMHGYEHAREDLTCQA